MSTAQKLTDHFLTCTICSEVYRDPATLKCEHTFCRPCLVQYTKTKPEALKDKSIPCAFCRQHTKVPDPSKPVEQWADQLKTSFLVQSLMDDFGPGAEETTFCGICRKKGKDVHASAWCTSCSESFCETCLDLHNLMPMSHGHQVDDLSGRRDVIKKRKRIFCKTHNEIVKIFCKDCDEAICNTCCSISHRACVSVVPVESMMQEIRTKLMVNKGKMEGTVTTAKETLKNIESLINVLTSSSKKTEDDIKEACRKIVDIVHKHQNLMLKEAEKVTSTSVKAYKEQQKSLEMTIQMSRQTANFIDQTLRSDSDSHIYDMYQSCRSSSSDPDIQSDKSIEHGLLAIRVGVETDIKEDQLGASLKKMISICTSYKGPTDGVSSLKLLGNIDINSSTDVNTPNPNNVHHLNVNGSGVTIIADISNKCLKAYYSQDINTRQPSDHLVLDAAPWSIAHIGGDHIVATVPEQKQIITVTVMPALSILSKLKTTKEYIGIAAYGTKTLVAGSASSSPPCIDVLDVNGKVLRSITDTASISVPNFLSAVPGGNIFISDSGLKSIVCLSSTGEVVFKYHPIRNDSLRAPRGITIDAAGNVLFVDRDASKVTHLTPEGLFVRHVLTSSNSVLKPCGVCLDSQHNLYITERGRGVKYFGF